MNFIFEKKKSKKSRKIDDTGSHIIVAPDQKNKKLHIFGLKNTDNPKKIRRQIPTSP